MEDDAAPRIVLPCLEAEESQEDAKAARAPGLNILEMNSASKVKNRSGETVVITQLFSSVGELEWSSLQLSVGAAADGAHVSIGVERSPSVRPERMMVTVLEDNKQTWLYSSNGKTITVCPKGKFDQFHAINMPLPGWMKRVIIEGDTTTFPTQPGR